MIKQNIYSFVEKEDEDETNQINQQHKQTVDNNIKVPTMTNNNYDNVF